MKIFIVINDYLNNSNGMCISTQRFVEEFRAAGHEVRIATNNRYGELDYPLDVVRIPVFAGIIEKEGFTFAHADRKLIREAVTWADVVHVEDPFFVCHVAAVEARRQSKPLTGTFHLYPENMTYAVHLGSSSLVNGGFMRSFVSGVYDRCLRVQCPTTQVRDRLQRAGAKADLEVISNGIAQEFIAAGQARLQGQGAQPERASSGDACMKATHTGEGRLEKDGEATADGPTSLDRSGVQAADASWAHLGGAGAPAGSKEASGEAVRNGAADGRSPWGAMSPQGSASGSGEAATGASTPAPLRVLSVGRFAPEKNQRLLLEAVAQAKHGTGMRVTLAGKGPIEADLRRRACELGLQVDFGFRSQADLRDLMCASDVYVHCADVEVEGMSCMEAFACGCVPLICDAPLSSTSSYALTPHNLFGAGDAADLAAKLDWLYENRTELASLSRRYVEFASGMGVRACAREVLAMMGRAADQARLTPPAAKLRVRLSHGRPGVGGRHRVHGTSDCEKDQGRTIREPMRTKVHEPFGCEKDQGNGRH